MFEDKLFFLPSQDTRTHKTHTCSKFLKIFSSKQDFRRVGFRQSIVRCKNWRAQHFLGPSESNRRLNFGLNGFGKCQVGVGVGSAEHKFLFLLFQVELIWSRPWYLIIPINDCLRHLMSMDPGPPTQLRPQNAISFSMARSTEDAKGALSLFASSADLINLDAKHKWFLGPKTKTSLLPSYIDFRISNSLH